MTTGLKLPELPKGTIAKRVENIDRSRTPYDAIKATGRVLCLNDEVVKDMPMGEGKEKEVFLIPFEKTLTPEGLEQEVDKIGVELADPNTVCALNEQYPELADTYPNATQWRNKNGKACCAIFHDWACEREVTVFQNYAEWSDSLFVVCILKESTEVSES
jgi:hypothetical protein